MNKITPVISFCIALAASIFAADESSGPDFGYGSMELYKFSRSTRQLETKDIDGDGLDDIIFLNNAKSRVEVLLRKKEAITNGTEVLKDNFENNGIISDQMVTLYRLADINNDGKPDIVTMGTPLGLFVRYQNDKRKFSEAHSIFINDAHSITTIQTGDINEDGLDDIIVSHRRNAEIIWNDSQQTFQERKTILYADDKCFNIELVDADRDGHLDLLQYYHNKKTPIKVRLGDGHGNFGVADLLQASNMKSVVLIQPEKKQPPMIAGLMGNGLGMRIYGFTKTKQPELLKTQKFTPQTLAIPAKGKTRRAWITADFDGDGNSDLLAAAPTQNKLYLYKGGHGGLEPSYTKYNTLAQVNALAQLADNDILVVSCKEKSVGIHRHNNMAEFPQLLALKGELVTAGAIRDTKSIFVVRKDDDDLVLDCYNGTKYEKSLPLELDEEPSVLTAFTLDDSTTGIMLFTDYSQPKMMLLTSGSNKLEKISSDKFSALSQNLTPAQVMTEKPGSGKSMIVANGSTIRRYEWKDAQYHISKQFDPMNEQAKTSLLCTAEYGGKDGFTVYDANSKNLLWYTADEAAKKIHIDGGADSFDGLVQLKNTSDSVFLMVGDNDIAVLADKAGVISLKENGEYMSDAEKPQLRIVRSIKVGNARSALALVDAANRSIEIVYSDKTGIKHVLTFVAFLKSSIAGPVSVKITEPHDIKSGDINGDGISDMILLAHDKLIIYIGD